MAVSPDTQAWVSKAEDDASAVSDLASISVVKHAGTLAYHSQQCAEKYLKALLVEARLSFPRSHDFSTLIDLCMVRFPAASGLRDAGNRLQPFAVEVRYPYATPTEAEARQAIVDMCEFRNFCRRQLGVE
jgi:HEPN domain-containing protein